MKRLVSIAATLLAGLVGCLELHAQDAGKNFATPQDTFRCARAALAKDDLARLCDCLSDDSRDLLGGGLTANVLVAKKRIAVGATEDDLRLVKKLDEVLARHGLLEKNLRPLDPLALAFQASDPPNQLRIARLLLAPVKDRNTYVAELVRSLQRKGDGVGALMKGRSDLVDVKIDGDSAKAIVITTKDGKDTRAPILFKKAGDNWKIDMTAELHKTFAPRTKSK